MNKFLFEIKKRFLCYLPAILILQAFLLVLFSECITFYDFDIPYTWVDLDNLYFIFYNMGIYLLPLLLFFCVTKRTLPGYIAVSVITTVFSVVNNMKWNQLKECVSFADLSKLSEAATVGKEAEFLGYPRLSIGIGLILLCGIPFALLDKGLLKKRKKRLSTAMHSYRIGALVYVILFVLFIRMDWNHSALDRITENRTADITGPAVYFIESMERVLCEEAYTEEQAKQSYAGYVEKGKKEEADYRKRVVTGDTENADHEDDVVLNQEMGTDMPNVIVIMSEAFYDVNQLEGAISYSKDPMAVYNGIAKDCISGSVAANIYGGSTHYSEFEFLTGWNTRGMSLGGCPYKEYFKQFQPSLVKYYEDAGYSTQAIHPYEKWFWNRQGAYNEMGFDHFYGRNDMKYKEMCGYISDESLTKEIVYRYEDREDKSKPFFCFAVSMANHIARINDDQKENSPEQIAVDFKGSTAFYASNKKLRITRHVSGMEKSGEALKALTDYYKTVEEPTVIVFFGDHAPSYAAEVLKAGGLDEENAYATPFLIWSNYDLPGRDDNVMDSIITGQDREKMLNISYLSTYLLEVCGMPIPSQGYYNLGLFSDYPVETRYRIENREKTAFHDYTKEQRNAYIERAEDLKSSAAFFLENPESNPGRWDYGE